MPMSTTLVILRSVVGQQPVVVGPRRARPVADAVARQQDLADDLRRIEIAHEALGARVAEACRSACSPPARRCTACRGRSPGCRPSRSRARAPRARASAASATTCACRRRTPARRRSRAGRACRALPAACAAPSTTSVIWSNEVTPRDVEPAPQLDDAHALLLFGHADRGHGLAQPLAREPGKRRLERSRIRNGLPLRRSIDGPADILAALNGALLPPYLAISRAW